MKNHTQNVVEKLFPDPFLHIKIEHFYWFAFIINTGVGKFPFRRPTFRTRKLTCAPDLIRKKRALKSKVQVLDTTRNTYFCSLLSKYHSQLSFSNVLPSKVYAMRLL